MVISSSTRLLDGLARQSVPGWLTARNASLPTLTQGILCWQVTAAELSAAMKQCASRGSNRGASPQTALKLWLGYGADSLGRNSWYAVGQVKVVARSRRGAAAANPYEAPPGTVLDISPSGVTVSVVDGVVRLSQFLTPLGRPLAASQLPLSVGQHLPKLTLFQQRAIAQLATSIADHESTWHRRLTELCPLPLPYGAGEPGLGSIFGHAPLALEASLAQGTAAFHNDLAEFGGAVLLTVLGSYFLELSQSEAGQQVPLSQEEKGTSSRNSPVSLGDIGLRSHRLQHGLRSEELAALFASHVPARFSLDLRGALRPNLEVVLRELSFLEEAVTHRQDLALGINPTKLPSLYALLVELVAEVAEQPHRLGQALTIQLAESGEACTWFYNPAVLSEEEVQLMQEGFLARLAAIAQAPQLPLGAHGHGPLGRPPGTVAEVGCKG
jgi:hypothetical protein